VGRPYNSGLPEARQATPFNLELWKQWEGQSVDSVFPLERCTGGSSRGAVFETLFQSRPAAIKIVPGTPESIDALVASWQKAASRSHKNLVEILASGETALGEMRCAYVVMERADENLAEVLAERLLTPVETRDMVFPVLGALHYLHANGFAHGRLKPSNIMAFGEQLKISSDSLVPGGDTAADCRAIGVLLEEVLDADQNSHLPEPFAKIANNCLMPDPARRWNTAQIEAYLRGEPEPAARARSRASWWGLAAAAAVILGLIATWAWQHNNSNKNDSTPVPRGSVASVPIAQDFEPTSEAKTSKATKQARAGAAAKETSVSRPLGGTTGPTASRLSTLDGITQVLPEIPQAALDTITGRVRINVRVYVDSAGQVNQTTLEPPPASKYFTDRVLVAAHAWKFPAGNAPQDWLLHFELMRQQTRVSAAKIVN
jgi:Protein kinase domain